MNHALINCAFNATICKHRAKIILIYLATFADENGEVCVAVDAIARACDLSRRTCTKALGELRRAGYLKTQHREQSPSIYSLTGKLIAHHCPSQPGGARLG